VLIDWGQASVNEVAAIPSLHAGVAAMVAIFLWRRMHWRWRPLLVGYALIMAFALVYSAEHYVIDILLGWAFAVVVLIVVGYLEARGSRSADKYPCGGHASLACDETACEAPARSRPSSPTPVGHAAEPPRLFA
jgi:membrane-associated phospholipid phosphatase